MNRKDHHVILALEQYAGRGQNQFDQVRLVHHSLRSIDVSEVDIRTRIGSISLETPFFINAMTGGSEWTRTINAKIAEVARRTGLAMAVGSMSAALRVESRWESFQIVREVNPHGVIFANLNANYTAADALKAVEKLEANAIQVHINAPQEIVMSEGDRSYSHWAANIAEVARTSPVDVIVKEVGFGMSRETIEDLLARNVRIIDVSGTGGTNFAAIENERRTGRKMEYLNSWGQSTVESLLETGIYRDKADLISSGGVRHPLDFVKSFVLGARAVGLAAPFLHGVMNEGVGQTVERVESWKQELKLVMSLLGARTIPELRQASFILSPELMNYCSQRGITPGSSAPV